jgi:hypothetical protein
MRVFQKIVVIFVVIASIISLAIAPFLFLQPDTFWERLFLVILFMPPFVVFTAAASVFVYEVWRV